MVGHPVFGTAFVHLAFRLKWLAENNHLATGRLSTKGKYDPICKPESAHHSPD